MDYSKKPNSILYDIPYALRPFSKGSILYDRPYSVEPPYVPQDREVTLMDYNDPTELNSVADVILNQAAKDKLVPMPEGMHWLPKYVAQTVASIPILTYRTTIKPHIVAFQQEKGWRKLDGARVSLLNTFTNAIETLDALGNVVKGAALEEEGAGVGIKRALGIGDEGRFNYDWDTGSVVADIGLEIVSDPFNWATLGAAALGKRGVASASKAMSSALRKALPGLTDDGIENVGRLIGNNLIRQGSVEEAVETSARILARPGITHRAMPAVADALRNPAVNTNIRRALTDSVGFDTARAASTMWRAADKAQLGLVKSVGWTSGITPVVRAVGASNRFMRNLLQKRVDRMAEEGFTDPDGVIPFHRMEEFRSRVGTFVDPLVDAGHAEKDLFHNTYRALQLRAATKELFKVNELVAAHRSPQELLGALDKYFLNQSAHKRPFLEVVPGIQKLAEDYPDYKPLSDTLTAVAAFVRSGIAAETGDQLAKFIPDAYHMVEQGMSRMGTIFDAYVQSGMTAFPSGITLEQVQIAAEYIGRNADGLLDVIHEAQRRPEYLKYLNKLGDTRISEGTLDAANTQLELISELMHAVSANDMERMRELWERLSDYLATSRRYNPLHNLFENIADRVRMQQIDLVDDHKAKMKALSDLDNPLRGVESGLDNTRAHKSMDLFDTGTDKDLWKGNDIRKDTALGEEVMADLDDIVNEYLDPEFEEAVKEDFVTELKDSITDLFLRDEETISLNAVIYELSDMRSKLVTRADDMLDQYASRAQEKHIDLVDSLDGLIDKYKKILKEMENEYDLSDVVSATVQGQKVYGLITSKAYSTLTLADALDDKFGLEAAREILSEDPGSLGAMLGTLAESMDYAGPVLEILDFANSTVGEAMFIKMLQQHPETKEIFRNVYDVLQSYRGYPLYRFIDRDPKLYGEIQERLQGQLTMLGKRASLDVLFGKEEGMFGAPENLENLKNFLSEAGEEVYTAEDLINRGHIAAVDVLRTMYLAHRELLPEVSKIVDFNTQHMVVVDVESTGSEVMRDYIWSISIADMSGHRKTITVPLPKGVMPDESLLQTLLRGHDGSAQSIEKAIQDFLEIQESSEYSDMSEALLGFIEYLRELETEVGKNLVLVGYNNTRFDDLIIEYNLRHTDGVPSHLAQEYRTRDKLDLLQLWYKKQGVSQLTPEQWEVIRNGLDVLVQWRLNYVSQYGGDISLLSTPGRGLANSFSQVAETLRNNRTLSSQGMGDWASTLDYVQGMYTRLYESSEFLAATNKSMSDMRIVTDADGLYQDANGHVVNLGEAGIHVDNVMQLFMEQPNQLTTNTVKRLIDTKILKDVYPSEEYLKLPAEDQQVLSSFAISYHNISSRVRHVDAIAKAYDILPEVADRIMRFIEEGFSQRYRPLWLRMLDTAPTGTISRFVTTYKLYKYAITLAEQSSDMRVLHSVEDLTNELATMLPGDLMVGLKDIRRMYNSAPLTLHIAPFTAGFFTITDSDRALRARQYFGGLQTLDSAMLEKLKSLDNLREDAGIADREGLAHAVVLRRALDIVHRMVKYVHDLAETGPAAQSELYKIQAHTILNTEYRSLMLAEHTLLDHPPEDLKYILYGMSGGHITYSANNAQDVALQGIADDIYERVLTRKDELEAYGLKVNVNPGLKRVTVSLPNDEKMLNELHEWELKAYNAALEESQRTGEPMKDIWARWRTPFRETPTLSYEKIPLETPIKEAAEELEFLLTEATGGKNLGTLGEMFDYQDAMTIFSNIPAFARQGTLDPTKLREFDRFRGTLFNRSNLGTQNGKRELSLALSSNPAKTLYYAFANTSSMLDAHTKYVRVLEDPSHTLHQFSKEYGLTASQIKDYLKQNPDENLVVLYNNAKGEAKVSVLRNPTLEQIQFYMDSEQARASIYPQYLVNEAYKNVNDFQFSQDVVRLFNKYIVGPTKLGYLMTLGWIGRNIIDTAAKTIELALMELGPSSLPFKLTDFTKAYLRYKRVYHEVVKYHDAVIAPSPLFSLRKTTRYFATHPDAPISEELFLMMYTASRQSGAAGLSRVERERMIQMQGRFESKFGKQKKSIPDTLLRALTDNGLTRMIFSANEEVEVFFRMLSYFIGTETGLTRSAADAYTLSRHFDYAFRTPAMHVAEEVIPFATFTVANLNYWMNVMDSAGVFLGLTEDVVQGIANRDEYSVAEMQYNASLQYHMLAGNYIMPNGGVMKLNPSMYDALRTVTNPAETVQRFADYIQVPFEMLWAVATNDEDYDFLKKVSTTLPMAGPVAMRHWDTINSGFKVIGDAVRYRYVSRETHNYASRLNEEEALTRLAVLALPSMFGAVIRWHEDQTLAYAARGKYVPKVHIPRGSRYSSRTRYPRRTWHRRTYGRRTYHRNHYANKLFPEKRARLIYRNNGRQMRMPGGMRNLAHTAPSIYTRLYTGTGRSRFQNRLLPITPHNLAARLRSDWTSIR